ncbi:DUF418 domain-containing protein [Peribacillus sp. SCS-37]|uniref:DUF418 domain-containing protein n=1 Tax=Paraperibacillus esterisolvens TaxID=3115296 RepID=UPI003905C312
MPYFHSPGAEDPLSWWSGKLDAAVYILIDVFAQASFYPLFAFLFGFGAVLLKESALRKRISFPKLFLRRLLILWLFGCIHAFLVWHGDILITYAVFGVLLIYCLKWSGKKLISIGAWSGIIFTAVLSLLFLFAALASPESGGPVNDTYELQETMEIYRDGTFKEIFSERFREWYKVNNFAYSPILFFSIFPMFLLGAGFAKRGWLADVPSHRKLLSRISAITLLIAMAVKWLPYYTEYNYLTLFLQDSIGGPLLSIGYAAGFALLLQNEKVRYILSPAAAVGRMSISNYLLQSILCTFFFYSYGFGAYGSLTLAEGTLLALFIYGAQLAGSWLWLRRFQLGPVEYIWRYGTYGQRPQMKRLNSGESS